MSGVPELDRVYAAFEQTARLVGAPYSRETVLPVLTAFGDALADAGIVFAVLSGEDNAGELDYTVTVPPGIDDPYAVARAAGLVAATDHPVGTLLCDLRERLSVSEFLVDAGVAGGFKKIYAHFPRALQPVAKLADIPAMPPAVAGNTDFFARHGLDDVAMVAIDYGRRTTNLYFHRPPEPLDRQTVRSMTRECGLAAPSEPALAFAERAFRVNVTLGWDAPQPVRIALARFPGRTLDPAVLCDPVEPRFARFLRHTPHTYAGGLINLLGLKWTPAGEVVEFASYYQLSPMQRAMWKATHAEEV